MSLANIVFAIFKWFDYELPRRDGVVLRCCVCTLHLYDTFLSQSLDFSYILLLVEKKKQYSTMVRAISNTNFAIAKFTINGIEGAAGEGLGGARGVQLKLIKVLFCCGNLYVFCMAAMANHYVHTHLYTCGCSNAASAVICDCLSSKQLQIHLSLS